MIDPRWRSLTTVPITFNCPIRLGFPGRCILNNGVYPFLFPFPNDQTFSCIYARLDASCVPRYCERAHQPTLHVLTPTLGLCKTPLRVSVPRGTPAGHVEIEWYYYLPPLQVACQGTLPTPTVCIRYYRPVPELFCPLSPRLGRTFYTNANHSPTLTAYFQCASVLLVAGEYERRPAVSAPLGIVEVTGFAHSSRGHETNAAPPATTT